MTFHSSLSEIEEMANSFKMNERDHLDAADTYSCPTAAELSKAVSVSLGLDSVFSPINASHGSGGASADSDPGAGNSSRGVAEFKAALNMNSEGGRFPLSDSTDRNDDFGEVCHGIRQVSCMDLLRSGETDSAQTVTRGPLISRYVCRESNLFINPVAELHASSQVDQFLPLKPYSANPGQYRDPPSLWCADERTYGGRSEPERSGSSGHNLLCKYCNCGQTSLGSRQECYCGWFMRGEPAGHEGARAAVAHGYGQVERYQRAVSQDEATFSTVKTEPSVWMNCADRRFR